MYPIYYKWIIILECIDQNITLKYSIVTFSIIQLFANEFSSKLGLPQYILTYLNESNDNGNTKMQKQGTEYELNNYWDLDHVTTCTIDDEEPNK